MGKQSRLRRERKKKTQGSFPPGASFRLTTEEQTKIDSLRKHHKSYAYVCLRPKGARWLVSPSVGVFLWFHQPELPDFYSEVEEHATVFSFSDDATVEVSECSRMVVTHATRCIDHPFRLPVAASCTVQRAHDIDTGKDTMLSRVAPVCEKCLQEDEQMWKDAGIPVFRLPPETV